MPHHPSLFNIIKVYVHRGFIQNRIGGHSLFRVCKQIQVENGCQPLDKIAHPGRDLAGQITGKHADKSVLHRCHIFPAVLLQKGLHSRFIFAASVDHLGIELLPLFRVDRHGKSGFPPFRGDPPGSGNHFILKRVVPRAGKRGACHYPGHPFSLLDRQAGQPGLDQCQLLAVALDDL